MCGIAGIVSLKDNENSHRKLVLMLDAMSHRGSDDRGFTAIGNAMIGHLRLSINDLSQNAKQPFYQIDTIPTVSVTNGEIWNFKELKKTLSYEFKSNSDSEVINPLFNDNRMKELDGMFSTLILKENKLHIFRDWVGKIPLFIVKQNNEIFIASEIKALRVVTNSENVKVVPKNSHIIINTETLEMIVEDNYFGWIEDRVNLEENLGREKVAEATYKLIENGVNKRLISDVPIATLNSGGIDSSVITYLLSQKIKNLVCYTVKFDEDSPDLKHARLLAKKLNIKLVEVVVPRDEKIIKERFKEVCLAIEYPSNVQVQVGIMLSFIGEQMKKDGIKVVFSGEGSDESAGSYGNYRMWSKKPDWCKVKKEMFEKQHYGNLLRGNNIFMKYGTIECRTPFFDRDYVEYVCNLPETATTGKGKQWKQHLADAFKDKIPDEILNRPKEAFQKGTCFKTWFEDIIINDKDINKKSRKKLHHVIQDVITDNLKYNVRKCRHFEFECYNIKNDIEELFE